MRNANRHNKPSRVPLTLAVLACLQVAPALAQETTQQEAKASSTSSSTQRATDLDKVTVTGSLIRRADYETTSPVFTINAETNAKQGQVNVAEFLQKSAIGSAETQITHQFGGFVVDGGTGVQTVSLRGLGANRTLVLLDGQRPGPAGTRGAVGAFDLNVIPTAILQRAEIVKDGSSSIYGSDAVAGVVNLITKKNIERPELTVTGRVPTEGGGEVFSASLANGWNFEKGSIIAAVEWYQHNELTRGDRDFLNCSNDLIKDADGNRIDREDRSLNAGTPLANCNNMLHNVVDIGSTRYVPSRDGSTVGPLPGYRPRTTQNYTRGQAFYDEPVNFERWGQGHIINKQERKTAYLATDFGFDSVNWKTQFLFNRRETETFSWRQFFPYAYVPGTQIVANPVMLFKSQQDITVDYFYAATKLDGLFKGTDTWAWEVNANFSHSKGKYGNLAIQASKSGDLDYTDEPPAVNYFDPDYLSGRKVDELVDKLGAWDWGKTIYKQATINAIVSGDLFEMPAGAVGVAAGLEYRYYSLNDQPSELSRTGDIWGSSSADVTKGNDKVKEAFVEVDVPLLKGLPAVESLSINASGRVFKYDNVADSDNVWKVGVNWQIIPSLRLRGSIGTSYRAPGLYELYLGNETGFFSQANDPCVRWGESSNTNYQANCAAAGIPANYAGGGSSGTVYRQGGGDSLIPETSRAKTAGIVFTPTFANLSVAIDYFDYEVSNEIAQLGSTNVLRGCYGGTVYPNSYCDLLTRNSATATQPYAVTEIQNKFININKQRTRGYDLTANFDHDFSFGKFSAETQVTYTIEDTQQVFSSAAASGLESSELLGDIGRPKVVGNLALSLTRGDWSYNWLTTYIHKTEDIDLDPVFTYQGRPNSYRDIVADSRIYHTASVSYAQADWEILVGVSNIFNKTPPLVSTGVADSRYGNVPAFATQYDYYGRTPFVRLKYKF
ncbi:MAG: TonB-dependent receptor [Stenotrophomonas sp.]|uniref:TonB-dependent receptor plug domain-containing protein n=1 Tax=Stenotrophomonas sp. NA06056 TaxID=2742129 RepID=UPI00158F3D31|nr:TonB-dependent receptor [Stenotrophomonas sp. NA06056]QKW56066.1 TonB-dependent receptor [Stenotrophomonas sp. NA06056]